MYEKMKTRQMLNLLAAKCYREGCPECAVVDLTNKVIKFAGNPIDLALNHQWSPEWIVTVVSLHKDNGRMTIAFLDEYGQRAEVQ